MHLARLVSDSVVFHTSLWIFITFREIPWMDERGHVTDSTQRNLHERTRRENDRSLEQIIQFRSETVLIQSGLQIHELLLSTNLLGIIS